MLRIFVLFSNVTDTQAMNISSEGFEDIGIEQLELITHRKAGLPVESSTVIGAIVGGAGEVEVERLRKYARSFSLMGQVVDDILGWRRTRRPGSRPTQRF